ncbi:MAG: AsmA family protein, partial [Gemmatimonadota bacterium]|nr:AsmA family protein [Gemmatimonadota bacterium]
MTALSALLVVVLVLSIALPVLFGDRIAQRVKLAVNQNVDAHVDWRDAGLSVLKNFPHLTLTLDDLTTVGTGRFQNDTLAAVRHVGVVLDVTSVLGNVMGGKPIVIRAIELERPRLTLVVLEDGSANWDITKKSAAQAPPETSKPFAVSLRRFEISNASIGFDNRQSKLTAGLIGFNQTLSGDLSQDKVAILTRAHVDTATVTFAGITYLNHVTLGLDADVQADLANKRYTLTKTELSLNDLKLAVAGSVASDNQRMALDLAFKAPSTNFRSILSLVPAIYA